MGDEIAVSPEEIAEQFNEALAVMAEGQTRYRHSSYEDGVKDALGWVLGERDDPPMEIL